MNDILTKAVEALKEDQPDISYIRGMLETLLAMQNPVMTVLPSPSIAPGMAMQAPIVGDIPMPMNIEHIKKIAAQSTEQV